MLADKDISLTQLKTLSKAQIKELAQGIREKIIATVAQSGGHLASNLGVVEATIALHKTFNSPDDKFVFDVGHQCYAHKILTGRADAFDTIRTYGGLSGFSNPFESEHDVLYEGHCGTSLSAALGIAEANALQGKENYTVAIVGDGALTNGMIYEALNNCAGKTLNLIILINDNEMSISKNVGGLHRYMSKIRTSKRYFAFKRSFSSVLRRIPLIGKGLSAFFKKIKRGLKKLFVKNNLFEDMGLSYLGPVDGHNVEKLCIVLEEAKKKHRPCIVHMLTKKGLGYTHAEEKPENYHSVSPFDIEEGAGVGGECFSTCIGNYVCEKAQTDDKICAITAAMCDGTGLTRFAEVHPDRFYDVGIAEEHAVTFAGGLSVSGMKPVLFLYSTFAQRSFDQLFHDISIQKLPLVLALDRSGIVSGDGITHQGVFDYSLFSALPGTTVYSPESYADAKVAMDKALGGDGLTIVRYPKGKENISYEQETDWVQEDDLAYTQGTPNAEVVVVTYGRISYQAYRALQLLKGKYSVGVIKYKKVCPVDVPRLQTLVKDVKLLYFLEEGIRGGGFAEKVSAELLSLGFTGKTFINAIEDYISHGSLDELLKKCGLTGEQIAEDVCKILS